MIPCQRRVFNHYTCKVELIEVGFHSFEYEGMIPNTGRYACIYCKKTPEELADDDVTKEEKKEKRYELGD